MNYFRYLYENTVNYKLYKINLYSLTIEVYIIRDIDSCISYYEYKILKIDFK